VSFVIFVVNEIKMIVPGRPQGSLKERKIETGALSSDCPRSAAQRAPEE
jgi:hypothetical protein